MKGWNDFCGVACVLSVIIALFGVKWMWLVALMFALQAITTLFIRSELKEKDELERMQ